MPLWTGVSGLAKATPKIYAGVGGQAKAVSKGYVGVGGQAKLFYSADSRPFSTLYGTVIALNVPTGAAGTTLKSYIAAVDRTTGNIISSWYDFWDMFPDIKPFVDTTDRSGTLLYVPEQSFASEFGAAADSVIFMSYSTNEYTTIYGLIDPKTATWITRYSVSRFSYKIAGVCYTSASSVNVAIQTGDQSTTGTTQVQNLTRTGATAISFIPGTAASTATGTSMAQGYNCLCRSNSAQYSSRSLVARAGTLSGFTSTPIGVIDHTSSSAGTLARNTATSTNGNSTFGVAPLVGATSALGYGLFFANTANTAVSVRTFTTTGATSATASLPLIPGLGRVLYTMPFGLAALVPSSFRGVYLYRSATDFAVPQLDSYAISDSCIYRPATSSTDANSIAYSLVYDSVAPYHWALQTIDGRASSTSLIISNTLGGTLPAATSAVPILTYPMLVNCLPHYTYTGPVAG